MAETVRDVLIKLKIQQEAFSFTLPDPKIFEATLKRYEKMMGAVSKLAKSDAPLTKGTEAGKAANGDAEAAAKAANLAQQAAAKRAASDKAFLTSLGQQRAGLESGAAAAQIFGVRQSNLSDEAKKSAIAMIKEADALRKSAEQKNRTAAETKRLKDESQKLITSLENQNVALRDGETAARIYAVQNSNLTASAKAAAIELIKENEAIKQQGAVAGHLMASADGMKMAGEGAAALGRGLMVLTAASDEEIQILARKFLMYTAFLDVFKGATDLVKGMIVVNRSLVAAHAAATVAAGVQSVATTGLTASLIAARTAALSMWVALGPLGWAVLAGIAAITLGVAAWNHYRDAQKSAQSVTIRYAQDLSIASQMYLKAKNNLTELAKAHQDYANKSATSDALRQLELSSVTASPVGMEHMTEQQRAASEMQSQEEQFRKKMKILSRGASETISGSFGSMGINPAEIERATNDLNEYEKTRQKLIAKHTFSQRGMDMQQSMINDARQSAHENPGNANMQQAVLDLEGARVNKLAYQQAQMAQIEKTGRQLLALEVERKKAIDEQRTAIQANIDRYRQMHEANRAAIKEEENRNKSMAQRFGALTDAEQGRIKALAKAAKDAGGIEKLSRQDQEELRASGFADSAFTKIDLARGQAAGADQLFSDLGTFKPGTTDQAEGQGANETRMDFLKRERDSIQSEAAKQEKMMADIIKQQADQFSRVDQITRQLGDLTPLIQSLERMMEIYRNHLARIEEDIRKMGYDVQDGQVRNRR